MAVKDEELRTYIKMLHILLGVTPVDIEVDFTLFVFLVSVIVVWLSHDSLFDLILYIPSTIFQLNRDRSS